MNTGPWRQHWSALIGTLVRDGVIVASLWVFALYAEWPWLLVLALSGFVPSLLAYVHWCCRYVCLTATELVIQTGVVTTRSVSLPMREIDVLEARQTLWGKLFDYGDIAIRSGPNAQAFERLHPFSSFMAAYQARRRVPAGWFEPDGDRVPPAPRIDQLPAPLRVEPHRERPPMARTGGRPQQNGSDRRSRHLEEERTNGRR